MVRLPDEDEPWPWAPEEPPLAVDEAPVWDGPLGRLGEGLRLRRQEAEDAAFVTAAEARARQRLTNLPEDWAASGGLDEAAAREAGSLVDEARGLGLRPSEAGLAAARSGVEALTRTAGRRALVADHNARVERMIASLDEGLAGAVEEARVDPERLDELAAWSEAALTRARTFLDEDATQARRAGARAALAEAAVRGLGERDPDAAAAALAAGAFDDLLAGHDDARSRLAALASAASRDHASTQEAMGRDADLAVATERFRTLKALERAVSSGAAGEAKIAEAVAEGVIDEADRGRLTGLLETRRAGEKARAERVAQVNEALAEGAVAEVAAEDAAGWRRSVDDHFAVFARGLAELDPGARAAAEDDYARAVGVVPAELARTLRAGLLSGMPAEEVAAASRIMDLAAIDPTVADRLPPDERDRAGAIAERAVLRLPPERTVALADEALRELQARLKAAGERPGPSQWTPEALLLLASAKSSGRPLADDVTAALALIQAIEAIRSNRGTTLPPSVTPKDIDAALAELGRVWDDFVKGKNRDPQFAAPIPVPPDRTAPVAERTMVAPEDEGPRPLITVPPVVPDTSIETFPEGEPPEPLPGFEPPDVDRGWVEIYPAADEDLLGVQILENRRGSPPTQDYTADVARLVEVAGDRADVDLEQIAGSRNRDGEELSEEYQPPKEKRDGRKGGSYPDITFLIRDTGRRLHINTVDTKADGSPTKREREAASRLWGNVDTGDMVVEIGFKPKSGQKLDDEDFIVKIIPLLLELKQPFKGWGPDDTSRGQLWRQLRPKK